MKLTFNNLIVIPGIRGYSVAGCGGGGGGTRHVNINVWLAHSSFSLQAGKLISFSPFEVRILFPLVWTPDMHIKAGSY